MVGVFPQQPRSEHLPDIRTATGTARRNVVRALGAVAALAAAEHGIGELTQPEGAEGFLLIESWPHVAAFESLSGEPAMTLIPDVRVTGLVTVVVSAWLAWWAFHNQAARRDGWVLLGLSALLLLTGGGFGPALLTAALGAMLLRSPHLPDGHRRARVVMALAGRWRPLLVLTVGAFLALFPGVVLLDWATGVDTVWLAAVLPIIAFCGVGLTLAAARAQDTPPPPRSARGGRRSLRPR